MFFFFVDFVALFLNTLSHRRLIGLVSFLSEGMNPSFKYSYENCRHSLLGSLTAIKVDGFVSKLKLMKRVNKPQEAVFIFRNLSKSKIYIPQNNTNLFPFTLKQNKNSSV